MTYKCELDWQAADSITVSVLKDMKRNLVFDLRRKGRVFENDPIEDAKIIKEHIQAVNLILKYFGK